MNGKDFLIYVDEATAITAAEGSDASYKPVAALTSNGFSGSTGSIETTTKDTNGWDDSEPGNGSWEISGELNAIAIEVGDTAHINFEKLSDLWLTKKKFWARIANASTGIVREGVVYISKWDESFPNNDNFKCSVTFKGCGKPILAAA